MKIAVILDNARFIAGGDLSIFKFSEAMVALGHEIILFSKNKDGVVDKASFPVVFLPAINLPVPGMRRLNAFLDKYLYVPYVIRYLKRRGGVDWVVGYQKTSAVKASIVAKALSARLANFIFESPRYHEKRLADEWNKVFSNPKNAKIWDDFKKVLLESDVVFPNSRITKESSEEWLGKKIGPVIYPGIDDFSDKVKEQNMICYVGRLYASKNVDELIRAVALLKNAPELVIAGDGDERSSLEALARKLGVTARFLGSCPDADKWRVVSSSKLMVFPTSFEGFGMPPGEALMAGKPCVCADIPILREVYGHRVVFFKEHDVKDLSKKIEDLLKSPSRRKTLGIAGRKFIRKTYNWKKSAQKIIEVLS